MLLIFLDFVVVLLCVYVFCFRSVSCVPNIVSVSGLSILDCPFGFLNLYLVGTRYFVATIIRLIFCESIMFKEVVTLPARAHYGPRFMTVLLYLHRNVQ